MSRHAAPGLRLPAINSAAIFLNGSDSKARLPYVPTRSAHGHILSAQCIQGAIGKLTLLKDKASDGVHKMRSKMGRNKDIKCKLHLKVTEQAHTCVDCAHVRLWCSKEPLNVS